MLESSKVTVMSVIQQQQNAQELFYEKKKKRKDEDRILSHRAALFKDKRKEAEVN